MSEEELIEVLRQFDEKRVEELPEKTRNIFYAIMKIADERDRLNNIINELEKYLEEESKYDEYVDLFYREHMGSVLEILKKLKENNK